MNMPFLTTQSAETLLPNRRPRIRSFDSGEECSLDHWLAVYKLVEESASADRHTKAEPPKVLLVDDEPLILRTLTTILKEGGFSVTAIDSSDEAVRVAHYWKPDILVIDLAIGGIDGVEAAKCISSHVRNCRVFVLTGQKWSHQEAGIAFLPKPLPPEELVARLWASMLGDGSVKRHERNGSRNRLYREL
jgi:CheY-like chemotaxis protein